MCCSCMQPCLVKFIQPYLVIRLVKSGFGIRFISSTNYLPIGNNEKRILPSRSGDNGGPCAIAKLVLAQARTSNQQKPKHKNLPQKIAFHLSFENNGIFYLLQAQRQSIPQSRLLKLNCFLTGGCFKKRYENIAAR